MRKEHELSLEQVYESMTASKNLDEAAHTKEFALQKLKNLLFQIEENINHINNLKGAIGEETVLSRLFSFEKSYNELKKSVRMTENRHGEIKTPTVIDL